MAIGWYWYVSMPKLRALELEHQSGPRTFLSRVNLSLDLSIAGLRASLSSRGRSSSRIRKRLIRIEDAIRHSSDVPNASDISKDPPIFFEFTGRASKFIQGGFGAPLGSDDGREDFYPSGAFVAAGYQGHTGVILIGNANNMYGSALSDGPISQFSQTPVLSLNRMTTDIVENRKRQALQHDVPDPTINSVELTYGQCHLGSFVKARSIAIFGANIDLRPDRHESGWAPDDYEQHNVGKALANLENVIVGSPMFVEQLAG